MVELVDTPDLKSAARTHQTCSSKGALGLLGLQGGVTEP